MKYKHYFEALLPVLQEEEEEVLYRHPDLPLSCNQLGAIYTDENYTINLTGVTENIRIHDTVANKPIYTSRKARIVLECFIQRKITERAMQVVFLDGNDQNMSYNNLKYCDDIPESMCEEAKRKRFDFKTRTAEYIVEKEKQLLDKGIDPSDYWKFFKLPEWIERHVTKKKKSKGLNSVSTKTPNAKNIELMNQIVYLKSLGFSNNAIAKNLGMKSVPMVKYWLTKNDILNGDIYIEE